MTMDHVLVVIVVDGDGLGIGNVVESNKTTMPGRGPFSTHTLSFFQDITCTIVN